MTSRKALQGVAPLTLVIPDGGAGQYVYARHLLEADRIDEESAQRLVDEGFLRWVSVDENGLITPLDEAGKADKAAPKETGGTPAQAASQAGDPVEANEVLQRRAAAAAKLPADGSAPDGRAATEVWVEYAVRQGYDRETVEKSSKDDIRALFKG
jgi:hypothetical protein